MPPVSSSHLVLIPSYNTGPILESVVTAALAHWRPVWVVVDGSTDRSAEPLKALAAAEPALRILVRRENGGKGAAILDGVHAALENGYTHVLTMDADGQHPAGHIETFMETSARHPEAMILGRPVFDASAPLERLQGRKLSIGLVHFETAGGGIADPLFGFRVYPAKVLAAVMARTRWARRYDFDPEVAVRLFWRGVQPINLSAPCRYLSRGQGGVSHFRYGRDNVRMVWLHTRLITEFLVLRVPRALALRRRWRREPAAASS